MVAIVGPVGTYLVATRKASGRIATTEADSLWKESGDIRKYQAEQMLELTRRITLQDERIQELERENRACHEEIRRLRERR